MRRKKKHARKGKGCRRLHKVASISSNGVRGLTRLNGMYFHPLTCTAEMNE